MTILDQLKRAYADHVKRFGCKPSVVNMTVTTHGLVAKALWEDQGMQIWNVDPYAPSRFRGIPIYPVAEPIESTAEQMYFEPSANRIEGAVRRYKQAHGVRPPLIHTTWPDGRRTFRYDISEDKPQTNVARICEGNREWVVPPGVKESGMDPVAYAQRWYNLGKWKEDGGLHKANNIDFTPPQLHPADKTFLEHQRRMLEQEMRNAGLIGGDDGIPPEQSEKICTVTPHDEALRKQAATLEAVLNQELRRGRRNDAIWGAVRDRARADALYGIPYEQQLQQVFGKCIADLTNIGVLDPDAAETSDDKLAAHEYAHRYGPKPKRPGWFRRLLHWITELSPSVSRGSFVKKQRWWRR